MAIENKFFKNHKIAIYKKPYDSLHCKIDITWFKKIERGGMYEPISN